MVVLGLGKTGSSVCEFLESQKIPYLATDDRLQDESQKVVQLLDEGKVTAIITSPGIPLSHPLLKNAQEKHVEVFCDVEYAFQVKKNKMVGITGTNGKTTTTLLTSHMLQFAHVPAKTVGNIGIPIFSALSEQETLVIELSSFQLQTMRTKALKAAVCLNISPNHLDHHATFDEYVEAKRHIATLALEEDAFFVGKKAHDAYFTAFTRAQIIGFDPSCDVYSDGIFLWRHGCKEGEVPQSLHGKMTHDLENFLAAFALSRYLGVPAECCIESYATFKKPSHRIELIANQNGLFVYDDSKATSIDAVVRAVETLEKDIVLIAGGVHKGFPYTAWKESFRGRVKKAFLNGPAASFIERDLEGVIDTDLCSSFEEAVHKAFDYASSGDKVLLSPGCSSFDRFSGYEERGKLFQQLALQNMRVKVTH